MIYLALFTSSLFLICSGQNLQTSSISDTLTSYCPLTAVFPHPTLSANMPAPSMQPTLHYSQICPLDDSEY